MSTHNICLYKEVDKKYTGCNLRTTEFLDCALIGICAVIIHAITSVGQSVRSEKNLSEISKNSVRFFFGAVFCHTK